MSSTVSVGASQSCTSGKAEAGESAPRALNSTCPKLTPKFGAEVDNLYSQFARTAMAHGGNDCFGTRTPGGFAFESYSVIHARVLEIGSGLAAMGYARKEAFGMYAANSADFQACVLGSYSRGMVCVPIYDTLGENIVEYEVNHADIKIMFCEPKKLMSVANVLSKCKTLKHVVSFAPLAGLDSKVRAAYDQAGVELIDLDSIRSKGKEKPVSPEPSTGEDLAYIMCAVLTPPPRAVLSPARVRLPPPRALAASPPSRVADGAPPVHARALVQVHIRHHGRSEGRPPHPSRCHCRLELVCRHRALPDGPLLVLPATRAHLRDDRRARHPVGGRQHRLLWWQHQAPQRGHPSAQAHHLCRRPSCVRSAHALTRPRPHDRAHTTALTRPRPHDRAYPTALTRPRSPDRAHPTAPTRPRPHDRARPSRARPTVP